MFFIVSFSVVFLLLLVCFCGWFFSGYHKAARTEQYTFLFIPLALCVLFSSSLSLSLSQKRDQRLICITCVYFQIDKFYLITTIERFASHTLVAHTDILYIDFYLIFSFFIKYLYRCFLCVWLIALLFLSTSNHNGDKHITKPTAPSALFMAEVCKWLFFVFANFRVYTFVSQYLSISK